VTLFSSIAVHMSILKFSHSLRDNELGSLDTRSIGNTVLSLSFFALFIIAQKKDST
jgi:hypothetical protein